MSDKLKPCPWCGGKAELSEDDKNMPRWIWCPECEADGPPIPYDFNGTAEEALRIVVDKWNTRVVDAENERLRGVIGGIRLLAKFANFTEAASTLDKIERKCREALEGRNDGEHPNRSA